MKTVQEIIFKLQTYWAQQGCVILPSYDMEMGAGTFHPATALKALGTKPWYAAFIQPSRRPADGRYGENPNRVQKHHQFQILLKPSPPNVLELYLKSLEEIGIDPRLNDLRFVEDNWESPTLGAAGLGWEVWCNGMEITQFTYFQQIGGFECHPVSAEITIGLERLAMYVQETDDIYQLKWNDSTAVFPMTYGDLFRADEKECSAFNFEYADVNKLIHHFNETENECHMLLSHKLVLPAYEQGLKASHLFNLLDARGAISVVERAAYIGRVRNLVKHCCQLYIQREEYA